ncbi:hypothetical protein VPH35_098560 [Triticum aestivum]
MEIAHRNREPFSVMSGRKRPLETLRQRFQAELVAVRRLLAEAAAVLPASSPSAPRVFVRPAEEPPAKKRKASHAVPMKKMTSKERDQLYADLTKLAKLSESHVLPAHILELLKKQSRRGICDDYIEIEMHAVQDTALVEMQKQLDKFVREKANPSTRQHKNMMAEEEDEDVDIVGGVSPLPVRPTPVKLLEEDEEYVDICGDASPVKNLGQDATISGSSGSVSDPSHQSVDSPAPAEHAANTTPPTRDLIARASEILERRRKQETSRAREKARQQVVETKRTAMFNDALDEDVKALGIDQYNTARPNNLLRQMGLFRKDKADDDDDDLKQQQHQSLQEDLEEGEIRLFDKLVLRLNMNKLGSNHLCYGSISAINHGSTYMSSPSAQSSYTGDDVYILEFFLPPDCREDGEQKALLESMSVLMKQNLRSLNASSHGDFGSPQFSDRPVIGNGKLKETDAQNPENAAASISVVQHHPSTQSINVPRSKVWNHFKRTDGARAICNYCNKNYAADPKTHGTSRLLRHLKDDHGIDPKATSSASGK